MKLIFVTGGVISGLGKGISAASIGRILKSSDYSIEMIKIDPYLQVDAGTMSPYEHGEVFVTEDGAETDLDIGNYERFLNQNMHGDNNLTTGKIYLSVINKERNGEYLGKTVQVVPHITDEIKKRILKIAQKNDITIIEIGGTVGDIESLPFFEAIRQIKYDIGRENVLYIHVAPLLFWKTSGEDKTKPIQHTVKAIREVGIHPDILICRSELPLVQAVKNKIALLSDIDIESIIEAVDASTIYQVPLQFIKQNFHKLIQTKLDLPVRDSDLTNWNQMVNNIIKPNQEISICIIGKYTQLKDSYRSLLEALVHASAYHGTKINIDWIESEHLEKENVTDVLNQLAQQNRLSGILVPGGFGVRGIEGKIQAIRYARIHQIPFLGICLGLQLAVIEFARSVCHLDKANSTEFDENTECPIIDLMEDQKKLTTKGGNMRLGSYLANLKPNTLIHEIYQASQISERHRHRYEVNNKYRPILEENGLIISGVSPNKELVEFIELADHPCFIATQAHPEFKSRLDQVHPMFSKFISSAIKINK